ncbi:MAG: hypothetical protein AAGF53_09640 [Pseudomonadota bacterium]
MDHKLPTWVWVTILALLLIACIPMMAPNFGILFLPTVEWVSKILLLALGVSFALAFVLARTVSRRLKLVRPEMTDRSRRWGGVSLGFLGFLFGFGLIMFTMPMSVALLFGREMQIPYTVAKTQVGEKGSGAQTCWNPITLKKLPPLFNKLCNFSEEFVGKLSEDDTLLVFGKGTRFGVLVASARPEKEE